jgi:hypothetical protein
MVLFAYPRSVLCPMTWRAGFDILDEDNDETPIVLKRKNQ